VCFVLVLANLGAATKHSSFFQRGQTSRELLPIAGNGTFEHEHDVAEPSAGEQTQVTLPIPEHESYPLDH
jgi:hypothetical protein